VAPSPTNHNELLVTIDNAYPSYHCTVYATYTNGGTVPVKTTSFAIQEFRGTVPLVFPDMLYALELDTAYGADDECGTQVDPGDTEEIAIGFHVLQGAAQNAQYRVTWTTGVVNWNEFYTSPDPGNPDPNDMCTLTINGEQLYP
jgi:hypothetical protein